MEKKKLVTRTVTLYQKKQTFIVSISDSIGRLGGFIVFMKLFYGMFVRCINKKILLRNLIEDSFLVKNNTDFLELATLKPAKKPISKKSEQKSKKKKDLEAVQEEENEEDLEEGGSIELTEMQFEGGRSQKGSEMDVRSQRSQASARSKQSVAASVTKSQRS